MSNVYKHCVSLGWFCGAASSLQQLGLRSESGPFDWCFTDLEPVLAQIESRFADFMNADNLDPMPNRIEHFIDQKYGFEFTNHDYKVSFEKEKNEIIDRYIRRAKRFLETIKEPTLFFRVVRDEAEIDKSKRYLCVGSRILWKNNYSIFG